MAAIPAQAPSGWLLGSLVMGPGFGNRGARDTRIFGLLRDEWKPRS
jgi:hypothetical protein